MKRIIKRLSNNVKVIYARLLGIKSSNCHIEPDIEAPGIEIYETIAKVKLKEE